MTEPSTPTEPVEPTAPDADPTEPTEPTEPVEPVEPTEPAPQTETVSFDDNGVMDEPPSDEQFDAPSEQHIARVPSIETQKKQQDKDRKALEKENARHATAIKKIMGEDAGYNVSCPLCNSVAPPISADDQLVEVDAREQAGELAAGYLFVTDGSVIGEDKLAQLKTLLGIGLPSSLQQHPTVHRCETCDGKGECATGSERPGYESIQCPTCAGKGWEGLGVPVESITPANGATTGSTVTGPTVYTDPAPIDTFDDDPAVASLRERGFMVIPPMKMNAV